MKEPPKEKPKHEWSFISTSRKVLKNSKEANDTSSSSEIDPNKTEDSKALDNLSEADPDVKDFLSSSPRSK